MAQYKLVIEILSDTLFASAGGGAAVDSVTAHHNNGLPYIPSKTIKGLLKESLIEVLEIMGEDWDKEAKKAPVNQLFGKEGVGNEGSLKFSNGEILGKQGFDKEIKENELSQSEVLAYFTYIRHQTAINQEGIAKEGSLRTSQVLKPELKFEVFISDIDDANKELLEKACLNLRRAGTNRNRGFGKVKCTLKTDAQSQNESPLEGNKFKIELITPALLPSTGADSNTVSSEKNVSGRKILGMLASRYIKEYNLSEAHKDEIFKRLFLSGKVKYSDGFVIEDNKVCFPIGQHWVTNKEKDKVEIDFREDKTSENWKQVGGYYSQNGKQKASVSTILDFHNSRNKVNQKDQKGIHTRIKGSNQGDGIYYYESLREGQEFAFKIDGQDEDLEILRSLMSKSDQLRLGKSTSTALGKVRITNYDGTFIPKAKEDNNDYITIFVSPVILRNNNGEFDPGFEQLKIALGVDDLKINNVRIRTTKVQVFQGSIKMQYPEILAIAAGSSVQFSKKQYSKIKTKSIGEFTHEGYGKFVIESANDEEKQGEILKQIKPKENIENKNEPQPKEISIELGFLSKFVNTQREITKANADADKYSLHKNTTMIMISFFKEVEKILQANFSKAVEEVCNDFIKNNYFSNKVIDQLGDLLGFNGQDYAKKRKEKSTDFQETFLKEMVIKLDKKVNLYGNPEAKLAYWQTYFNNCKIKNRG